MSKKKTIGSNPLMAYLSQSSQDQSTIAKATADRDSSGQGKKISPSELSIEKKASKDTAKQRVTIHLSTDLINRVKDAVYWEPGLTLTAFAEQALSKALDKMEKKRGEKYPERKYHNLRGGRPLG